MMRTRYQRAWLLMATIAVALALVLMLAPHGPADGGTVWLAILPVLFVGVTTLLRAMPVPECFAPGHAADAPAFEPSFQRPPPFRRS